MIHAAIRVIDWDLERLNRDTIGIKSGMNHIKYCSSARFSSERGIRALIDGDDNGDRWERGQVRKTHLRRADFIEDDENDSLDENRKLHPGLLG